MVALGAVARKNPDTGIQNKSGCFSPASGGEVQTSCRRVPARYRCGTICRSVCTGFTLPAGARHC